MTNEENSHHTELHFVRRYAAAKMNDFGEFLMRTRYGCARL